MLFRRILWLLADRLAALVDADRELKVPSGMRGVGGGGDVVYGSFFVLLGDNELLTLLGDRDFRVNVLITS